MNARFGKQMPGSVSANELVCREYVLWLGHTGFNADVSASFLCMVAAVPAIFILAFISPEIP